MGGHPYWYFAPYDVNAQRALDALRKREFEAGRYSPVVRFLDFEEPAYSNTRPGPKHRSIAEAVRAAADEGTRSILDIERVGTQAGHGVAAPVDVSELRDMWGTDKPTRAVVDARKDEILGDLDRGDCVYLVIYDEDRPSEFFFAGYSYD
jgi:hypothetical protein